MLNLFIQKFREIVNALIMLDSKLGFKKLMKYTLLVLLVFVVVNIKAISINMIEFFIETSEELHSEKLSLRDKYMEDLSPYLVELRTKLGADRLLYFEFHNSESNLDGVPFKFFDLVKCSSRYGIPEVMGCKYKNIGAGMYPELFSELNKGSILICQGSRDNKFRSTYPGVFELFNSIDKSKQQAFFRIPGIKKPIGFIVVQWKDDSVNRYINPRVINVEFLPMVNAISVAKLR